MMTEHFAYLVAHLHGAWKELAVSINRSADIACITKGTNLVQVDMQLQVHNRCCTNAEARLYTPRQHRLVPVD